MPALSDNSADGPPDNVALSAVVAALDRAGLTVKSSATFEIAAKPFELVFDSIVSGSREKATALAGLPEIDAEIDAEIVDADDAEIRVEGTGEDLVTQRADEPQIVDVEIVTPDPVPHHPGRPAITRQRRSQPVSGSVGSNRPSRIGTDDACRRGSRAG